VVAYAIGPVIMLVLIFIAIFSNSIDTNTRIFLFIGSFVIQGMLVIYAEFMSEYIARFRYRYSERYLEDIFSTNI